MSELDKQSAMPLPSREAVAEWLRDGGEVVDGHQLDAVLALYSDNALRTNAEYREAIDYEALAAQEHDQWVHWTAYMLDNNTDENAERWRRQITTPYAELSEAEKESDREWARKAIAAAIGDSDECPACKGSGLSPEDHGAGMIEMLGCIECRGTGVAAAIGDTGE